MAKENNAYVVCPECKTREDLSGIDIGGLDIIPLPVHEKTIHSGDVDNDSEEMTLCSFSDTNVCSCSELLVYVKRPDETNQEWETRHPRGNVA
jgi:hypothetical protein